MTWQMLLVVGAAAFALAHAADLFLQVLREIARNTGRIAEQMELDNSDWSPDGPDDGEPLYETRDVEVRADGLPEVMKVVSIDSARHRP